MAPMIVMPGNVRMNLSCLWLCGDAAAKDERRDYSVRDGKACDPATFKRIL
jgi:hypothetical protein